ncbi:class I SAM-dependent methyltransferase [Flavobacteriaceae bacterium LMO-SS05]
MDLKELTEQNKSPKNSRHPWEQARLEFIHKTVKKHLDHDRDPIFLDIGCGDTYVAEQLLERIPKATFYCVDHAFTEQQLLYYSKKYKNINIKVFNTLKDATAQIESEISFVLILDVMEHVKNDVDFLAQIEQLESFKSKSKLLITVPAFQCLSSHHDQVLGHYRRYTNKTLESVTLKSGFQTLHKGYFFSALLLPRVIIKIKELLIKPKASSTSVAKWTKGRLLTLLYKNILILDFSITTFLEKIRLKPIGLSNYMICKKPVS